MKRFKCLNFEKVTVKISIQQTDQAKKFGRKPTDGTKLKNEFT